MIYRTVIVGKIKGETKMAITFSSGATIITGGVVSVGPTALVTYNGYVTAGTGFEKYPGTGSTTADWEISSWDARDADFNSGHLWALDEDTVLSGNTGRLVKVNQATGAEITGFNNSIAMYNGRIAADDSGNVYWAQGLTGNATSIRKYNSSGSLQWESSTSDGLTTLTATHTTALRYHDGAIYVTNENTANDLGDNKIPRLSKINASTGRLVWDQISLGNWVKAYKAWDVKILSNGNLAVLHSGSTGGRQIIEEINPSTGDSVVSTEIKDNTTSSATRSIAGNSTHIFASTEYGLYAVAVGSSGVVASDTANAKKEQQLAFRSANDKVYIGGGGFDTVYDIGVSGSSITYNTGSVHGGGGFAASAQLVMLD